MSAAERAPVGGAPGRALERVYRWAVSRRNRAFDRGERVTRIGVPVLSVGNLSVGGTGKTPTVAWLARELGREGLRPAIAMRGYRARGGESDEALEYRERAPGALVIARPDRAAAIGEAIASGTRIDCVILDDGFQHRFVARDFDLVLVDATRDPFEDRCLPAGRLREPVGSLARAGGVAITHIESVSEARLRRLRERIEGAIGRPPIAMMRHEWSGLEGDGGMREVEWLRNRRVGIVCGIGNPEAFERMAESAGAVIAFGDVRADHAAYTPSDVRRIAERASRSGAEAVLTTLKDWVKLREVAGESEREMFLRPRLELAFEEGEDALREAALRACGRTLVGSAT